MSITVNLRYTGKGNAAIDFAKEMTRSVREYLKQYADCLESEM